MKGEYAYIYVHCRPIYKGYTSTTFEVSALPIWAVEALGTFRDVCITVIMCTVIMDITHLHVTRKFRRQETRALCYLMLL